MLLNWTYLEVLVAGGLGFVTLELLPTVLTGHHWHGLLMVYLTLYEIKHTLLRLHSLFLKKMHDIQICFQQDNTPTFLSVNFKPKTHIISLYQCQRADQENEYK